MQVAISDIHTERGKAQWLASKKHTVGSGSISSITGVNPHKSQYALWDERVNDVVTEFPKRVRQLLKFGEAFEKLVAEDPDEWIDGEFSYSEFYHNGNSYRHPEHESLVSTPDFFCTRIIDGVQTKCIVETKWSDYVWSAVPLQYIHQINWQLGICGLSHGILLSRQPREGVVIYYIDFDRDLYEMQVESALSFLKSVELKVAPPVSLEDNIINLVRDDREELSEAILISLQPMVAEVLELMRTIKSADDSVSEEKKRLKLLKKEIAQIVNSNGKFDLGLAKVSITICPERTSTTKEHVRIKVTKNKGIQ